jgi:Acyl-CoA reductase (LuxC)
MQLAKRIDLLVQLGQYMKDGSTPWQDVKAWANAKNGWFIPEFINQAQQNIVQAFLQADILKDFVEKYPMAEEPTAPKTIGIVMAGNIPLVGFHDFMCCFLSGHKQIIKLAEKDDVLLKHLVDKLIEWDNAVADFVQFDTLLKKCDAYIATGSNNSARYFEQYFAKYPHIIRKNRTSIAVLNGKETEQELAALADDVHLFFGLGCRNVTKLWVPSGYDFIPLLNAFKKYEYFSAHNKYKNNYDYNLALHILNKVYYMTNETTLLVENEHNFSPISQLHYNYYQSLTQVQQQLEKDDSIQCVIGNDFLPFGTAQVPKINQFADGVDTMQFLTAL